MSPSCLWQIHQRTFTTGHNDDALLCVFLEQVVDPPSTPMSRNTSTRMNPLGTSSLLNPNNILDTSEAFSPPSSLLRGSMPNPNTPAQGRAEGGLHGSSSSSWLAGLLGGNTGGTGAGGTSMGMGGTGGTSAVGFGGNTSTERAYMDALALRAAAVNERRSKHHQEQLILQRLHEQQQLQQNGYNHHLHQHSHLEAIRRKAILLQQQQHQQEQQRLAAALAARAPAADFLAEYSSRIGNTLADLDFGGASDPLGHLGLVSGCARV